MWLYIHVLISLEGKLVGVGLLKYDKSGLFTAQNP